MPQEHFRVPLLSSVEDPQMAASPEQHICVCDACGQTIQKAEFQRGNNMWLQWTIIVCLLCTIFNCLVSIDISPPKFNRFIPAIHKGQYNSLKRPSPFIGLEKIQTSTSPRTLINYPQVIAQIDASNPRRIFDDDPKRYMSFTGYVSPEDRRVMVSPSISTIVQFRAIDFGMEKCELKLLIPANRNSSSGLPFLLSIHRLETTQPINTKELSFHNSPRRLTAVANLEFFPNTGVAWQRTFHCAWDDILTFDIGCSDEVGFQSDACSLEWWQNKEEDKPTQGIFMVQHSTV
ncbi:hypothetical protein JR316_0001622 [Psilocybe cubensis]|uniref:Uncharacterized protein n=2 Tax=Psilocybe cubensis TaxID=181762 RepID=A0ACB8HAN6_PSICU|nr:hypothetical protein JR316_0001622 [Psilocybe cubensis]KAH9484722.1 hypothetical protein JR316_0001622 [Psilocybe cubensis]